MSVVVYVEGGGDQSGTLSRCRRAFKKFISQSIPENRFSVTACGGRREAFKRFAHAMNTKPHQISLLLVDSEGPVTGTSDPKAFLESEQGDSWSFAESVQDGRVHLMVQVMEAWFLADRENLARFYEKGFRQNAIPGNPNIEEISKDDIERALRDATSQSSKKKYHKTRHGFPLLETTNAALVVAASAHARNFFEALNREIA